MNEYNKITNSSGNAMNKKTEKKRHGIEPANDSVIKTLDKNILKKTDVETQPNAEAPDAGIILTQSEVLDFSGGSDNSAADKQ